MRVRSHNPVMYMLLDGAVGILSWFLLLFFCALIIFFSIMASHDPLSPRSADNPATMVVQPVPDVVAANPPVVSEAASVKPSVVLPGTKPDAVVVKTPVTLPDTKPDAVVVKTPVTLPDTKPDAVVVKTPVTLPDTKPDAVVVKGPVLPGTTPGTVVAKGPVLPGTTPGTVVAKGPVLPDTKPDAVVAKGLVTEVRQPAPDGKGSFPMVSGQQTPGGQSVPAMAGPPGSPNLLPPQDLLHNGFGEISDQDMLGISFCPGVGLQSATPSQGGSSARHEPPVYSDASLRQALIQLSSCFQQQMRAIGVDPGSDIGALALSQTPLSRQQSFNASFSSDDRAGSAHSSAVPLATVRFPFGDARIDQEARVLLISIQQLLRRDPQARIVVQGHADHLGPEEFNLQISRQRAENVAEFIAAGGISPERMEVEGFGSAYPLDAGNKGGSLARNRRVDIQIKRPFR
ncbi:MAG: OmpA family protein [Magnetococcales bacterium]|nr:OmpA family protein [Magnetococcales bacterium]